MHEVQRIGQWLWCCGLALPVDPSMALEALGHPHGSQLARTRVTYADGRDFTVSASLPDLLDALTAEPDLDDIAARIRAAADRLGQIAVAPATPIP